MPTSRSAPSCTKPMRVPVRISRPCSVRATTSSTTTISTSISRCMGRRREGLAAIASPCRRRTCRSRPSGTICRIPPRSKRKWTSPGRLALNPDTGPAPPPWWQASHFRPPCRPTRPGPPGRIRPGPSLLRPSQRRATLGHREAPNPRWLEAPLITFGDPGAVDADRPEPARRSAALAPADHRAIRPPAAVGAPHPSEAEDPEPAAAEAPEPPNTFGQPPERSRPTLTEGTAKDWDLTSSVRH